MCEQGGEEGCSSLVLIPRATWNNVFGGFSPQIPAALLPVYFNLHIFNVMSCLGLEGRGLFLGEAKHGTALPSGMAVSPQQEKRTQITKDLLSGGSSC